MMNKTISHQHFVKKHPGFAAPDLRIISSDLVLREARCQRQKRAVGWLPPAYYPRHAISCLLVIGVPLLSMIATSTISIPKVLTRVDDGDRSARPLGCNAVALGARRFAGRLKPLHIISRVIRNKRRPYEKGTCSINRGDSHPLWLHFYTPDQ